jgi:putative Mg2+ transporter-C (MgtC) family protein
MSFFLPSLPLYAGWPDTAVRLVLTVVAGFLVGLDRGERGHAVGLRTTILVTLAAAVAMIQGNAVLATVGKTHESFAVMDIMRMPLGILTGIGFIGGGAIVKRDDIAIGVTTAATIWMMTVIGLCFGGGQLGLGSAGTLITLVTLRSVRWFEPHLKHDQHATVTIPAAPDLATIRQVGDLLASRGYETRLRRQTSSDEGQTKLTFEVWWRGPATSDPPYGLIQVVNEHYPDSSLEISASGRHRP